MTRYLTLAEYYWLAEQVTGIEATTLVATSRVELADSALHAAAAEFAGEEFYPDLVDKAAVLVCRLTKNHPLTDGNKRAAWVTLTLFVELNGGQWQPNPPDIDESEALMLSIASGEVDELVVAQWLRERVTFA